MSDKLRIFVASSSEQLDTVREAVAFLNRLDGIHAQPWEEEVFEFSMAYVESLEAELDRADFAIVFMIGDDASNVRGEDVNLPRDNVIFELGLFMGRLGRERCFFLVDGDSNTKIASDLSGVKPVEFYRDPSPDDALRPGLSVQLERIGKRVTQLQARPKPTPALREEQEKLWRFSTRLSGHWWERMREGEDDNSALSYVTISVDEVTNTPRLEGESWLLSGKSLARWWSVTTGVSLKENKVFYRWEGEHEDERGQKHGGHGIIELDDDGLKTGKGFFFGTNLASISAGGMTRVRHFGLYRASAEDAATMKTPWTREADQLVAERLGLRGR